MIKKLLLLTLFCLPFLSYADGPTNATQIKDSTGQIWMSAVPSSGLYFPNYSANKLYYINATGYLAPVTIGSNLSFTSGTLAATNGGGSVTSVGLTGPNLFTYGSPVTGSGNLSFSLANSVNTASGLVQLTGAGYLPALNGSLLTGITPAWSSITGTPTTLAGYGITNGLVKTNNLSDLSSAATSRTNLGLGSLSVVTPTGTPGANTWLNYTGSAYTWLQPAFSNLSGSLAFSQIPTGTTSTTVAIGNDTRFPATVTGIRKSGGAGSTDVAAVSGTDYAPATSGSFILAGNGTGGFQNVTVNNALAYGSNTLSFQRQVNAQTGTTYSLVNGDQEKLVTLSNVASIAVTLPQAGSSSQFVNGWHVTLANKGAGLVTVTPTTSTINGLTTLTIPTSSFVDIWSDGTNYQASTQGTPSATAYTLLANSTSATANVTGLQSGITLGTPGFTDTGVGIQQTKSVAGYFQNILQNTSNGTGSSTDFIVGNNLSTSSTYYGDFGINSSTFTGTGSLALPNATYLYSQTGDLVLATDTANTLRFVYNNGATDTLDIGSSGLVVPSFSTAGIVGNNSSGVLSSSTLTSLLDSSFSNTQGSLLYRGSSGWAALAPGTSGYSLQSGGASANPTWAAQSATTLGSGTYLPYLTSGAPSAATANQVAAVLTGTTGTLNLSGATITFPSAAANTFYGGGTSGAAAAPSFRMLVAGDIPSPLTASTTGNASTATAVTGTVNATATLANGVTGVTQSVGDSSTKIATDSFVLANSVTNPMINLGDSTYGGTGGTTTRLPGYTTANQAVLTQTGTGSASAAPAWSNAPTLSGNNVTITQHAIGNNSTSAASTADIAQQTGSAGPIVFRNRIINGDMRINQRAGTTITAGSAAAYIAHDRWYESCTGANCTLSQSSNVGSGFQYGLQITGLASNTGIVIGQKIEATNIYDLAGSSTVTVSFYAASSSLTSITCTAYTATGGVDTWSSRGAISGGAYSPTITSTLTRYSYSFTMSSDTNGVSIEFTGGALLGSQTFTLTGVQLEAGSVATPFERLPISEENQLCQRYYTQSTYLVAYNGGIYYDAVGGLVSSNYWYTWYLPVTMRTVTPTFALATGSWSSTPTITTSASRIFFTSGSLFSASGSNGATSLTASAEL